MITEAELADYLKQATRVAVWVQVSPVRQMLLTITKDQAAEIAEEFTDRGPIWGMFHDGTLEISLPSQWFER